MLWNRVKFSLPIFIIFLLHSQRVQAGCTCKSPDDFEDKINAFLDKIKAMGEPTTTTTLEGLLASLPPVQNEKAKPAVQQEESKPADAQQHRRRNTRSTRSISDTSTTTNDGSQSNYKCSERLVGICKTTGVSEIQLDDMKISPFPVLCDAKRWIVVLQRMDGSVAFHNRTFDMYKKGFGNIGENSEFFLGLQHLHELTFNGFYELRIDMEDHEGVQKYAHYSDFSIFNEQTAYKMGILGVYHGSAGDSFMYHEGQQFSTVDRDNDAKSQGSCSEQYNSPGWFKSCMEANIFGKYLRGETDKTKEGMYWEAFHGPEYSLKQMKMSIRAKC